MTGTPSFPFFSGGGELLDPFAPGKPAQIVGGAGVVAREAAGGLVGVAVALPAAGAGFGKFVLWLFVW